MLASIVSFRVNSDPLGNTEPYCFIKSPSATSLLSWLNWLRIIFRSPCKLLGKLLRIVSDAALSGVKM